MAKELRFYSIVLIVMFVLWSTPSFAYCPIPSLYGPDVYNPDNDNYEREIYWIVNGPFSVAGLDDEVWMGNGGDFTECSASMNAGTYYDDGNHKWVLNTDLDCAGNTGWSGQTPYAIGMRDGFY